MNKIALIGAYDKTDLILYAAKIFAVLGKRVLVIDATQKQKTKYVVPALNPTVSYITEFENMDVAVGFYDFVDLIRYIGIDDKNDLEQEYDEILIDIDSKQTLQNFEINEEFKTYFVTAFDVFSLKKGLEAIEGSLKPFEMTKILFSEDMSKEEDEYLNYLSLGKKVEWNDYRIYFPIENGDLSIISENQRIGRIKFKKLSSQYKDGLLCLVDNMDRQISEKDIRNAIKIIEKGD